EDVPERPVNAQPREPQSEVDRKRPEGHFYIGLGSRGRLFFNDQSGHPAYNDGGDVENRSEHGLTEAFCGKRAKRKFRRNIKIQSCISAQLPAPSPALGSGRSVAWLARLFRVQEVVSSNLTAPTIISSEIRESSLFSYKVLTNE